MELYVHRISNKVLAPHTKYSRLFITEHYRKTATNFKKFINERFENQPDAVYVLFNRSKKPMTRFRLRSGKITNLYKHSPITREKYKLIRNYGL